MRHNMRVRNGFTLIELIIVIVIIGILASIVAPMMGRMKVRAICAEAVTGLGTIRTAMRAYRMEFQTYPVIPAPGFLTLNRPLMEALGLSNDKLSGTYFSEECYSVSTLDSPSRSWLYIYAWPRPEDWGGQRNDSPGGPETEKIKDDVTKVAYINMIDSRDEEDPENNYIGKIIAWNIKESGYPER